MSENSWVIGDKELDNLFEKGKDILKTGKYVDQLLDIITNLSENELKLGFNIGLYGGWGSGKSSIVKTLGGEISKKHGDEFVVINFDCRKYNNNDLRRGILLDIDKNNKELRKILYCGTSDSFEEPLINTKKWRKYIIWSILISIIVGFLPKILNIIFNLILVIINSAGNYPKYDFKSVFSYSIFSFSFVLSIFSFLGNEIIKRLKNGFTINHTTSKYNYPLLSSEEFENEFNEIIHRKYEGKKILFVFDNIDRCESETVKEILMTIKTFLNKDNCIFLLPIDYDNVCKSYENYSQGDEYLRKIFNLSIQLEKPKYDDLRELVEKVILQNKWEKFFSISENEISEIAYILSLVFSDNPRKIKQFLNNLGAECLLYNKENPKNNSNICIIAKKLIIQQEIPDLYNILLKNKRNYGGIMKKLESYIGKYNKYFEEYKEHERQEKQEKFDDYESFIIFKQMKRLDEREMLIINNLSEIHGDFLNIGDYKSLLKDLIDRQEYEVFTNKIKNDNLVNKGKTLFEEYSKQIGKSSINDKKYIQGFIYFYIFCSSNNKLLKKLFKHNKTKYFEQILLDLNIEDGIFFKLVEILNNGDIELMGKNWISKLFTTKLLQNEKNLNISSKYKKNIKKRELLINDDVISKAIEDNLKNENIELTTIYKFLQENNTDIPNDITRNVNIPNRIEACSIEIINRLKLLSFLDDIGENTEKLRQLLTNSYGQDPRFVTNYLLIASILVKNADINSVIKDNLINIYRSFGDKQQIVEDVFYNYVKYNKPIVRSTYSNIPIELKMKKVIEEMIKNTNTENGLSHAQINNIYRAYPWDREENQGIVLAFWNNKNLKSIIVNYMKNESLSSIKGRIEIIKQYKKITNKDKVILGEIIYTKIIDDLGNKDKGIIDDLHEFLNKNGDLIDFILGQEREKIIELLNDFQFSSDDKEGPYYEKKIKDIIDILNNR